MPPKHNQIQTSKKLTDTLKKCHITPVESAKATSAGKLSNADTVIDPSLHPAILALWPKQKQKVPDIFLHKPVDFKQHVHKLLSMGIQFNQPYLSKFYTKIKCKTIDDHKALVQYFEKTHLPFNTFGNLSKRKLKVVIKGLPNDIDLNMLKSELNSHSIPVVRVHKMQTCEYKTIRPALILAVVPYNDDGKKLLQVRKIMGREVKVEPPNPKTKQCHRCQMWGHTQRYCHGTVKCVKCAGEHLSKKCQRDPEKEPPKCANCGGNHTANYRKCQCCPDSDEHRRNQIIKSFFTKTRDPSSLPRSSLVTLDNCDKLYKNIRKNKTPI